MAQTVIGMFDSSAEAQRAVQDLKNMGISEDRIDVSSASKGTGSSSSGTSTTDTDYRQSYNSHDDNDGIGGFFRSLFGDDDDDANRYSQVARHSDCLVTVHAQSSDEAQKAARILDQYGSVDVNERASQYGYTGSGTSAGMGANNLTSDNRNSDNLTSDMTGDRTIPIIEENLQVGKREVETGATRLRSRIVERPVEESVRLRSEHIRIERHATDRPATDADFNSFQEGEVEMTEHAEVPIVNKEARVVEEISLGKEVEEHEETVRETLRSTEVDIDRKDGDNTRMDLDRDSDNDRDRTMGSRNTDTDRPII